MKAITHPRSSGWRPIRSSRRQIDDEQIDRPTAEQRAGDRETLVEIGWGHDDEPVQADSAGHGFDRIEAPGEIQPGDDRADGLCLGHGSQGKRRLAARAVTTQTDTGRSRQAAATEDRVERLEAGRDDALGRRQMRFGLSRQLIRKRQRGKRADDLTDLPRSCRTPARPESRQCRCHIGGQGRHETRDYRTFVLLGQEL
jgi:hypothetical protein